MHARCAQFRQRNAAEQAPFIYSPISLVLPPEIEAPAAPAVRGAVATLASPPTIAARPMALAARAPASSPGPVPWAVEVTDLTFYIAPVAPEPALQNCSIQLPRGARCLLLGPNGAGKSTLLRLLAGKRMCKEGAVHVFGLNPFHHTPKETVSFLGTEWASNRIVVESDIVVSEFLDSVGGWRHAARRDRLLDLLDIDTTWHMNSISDGERRRVQLCMGLMAPFDLLLLDEVTVDLDVQVRQDLLDFLVQETKERNATIVCTSRLAWPLWALGEAGDSSPRTATDM